MKRRYRAALLWICCLFVTATGCASLDVRIVQEDARPPNNVWVFFSVKDGLEPVTGLTADDFVVYEDGQVVSKFESKQVIQNPELSAVMYTLLLLDMSGSITESGEAGAVVDAAKSFSERIGQRQKVAVYAFDGSEDIHSVVPFTEQSTAVAGGLEGLRTYKPKDPSTNLNGAVVKGLRVLKEALDIDERPLKFGTVVVFSDGADRAARVSRRELKAELRRKDYRHFEIYAIGVGVEIDKSDLEDIGRDGTELVTEKAKVKEAFDKVANRLEGNMKSYYLLSYCTPARKGTHEVAVEAKRKEPEAVGSDEMKFDADGFGPPPDCDPNTPPSFDLGTGGSKPKPKAEDPKATPGPAKTNDKPKSEPPKK